MLKVILIAPALAVFFAAASNPASPTGGESHSHQDANSTEHHSGSQDAQRGTPDAPFVVQLQQPQGQKAIVPEPNRDGKWHSRPDWWVVIFTAALFFATTGLWVFTALMWRAVRREFVATHRPHLRVRAIQFDGFTKSEIQPAWIYVANVGANPALNIRFDAVFTQRQGSIRKAPWIEKLSPSDTHGPKTLKAGQRGTYEPSTADDLLPFEAEEIRTAVRTLMLIGRIHYTDGIGTERQTGFGWRYDADLGEFRRPKEEDEYNYED